MLCPYCNTSYSTLPTYRKPDSHKIWLLYPHMTQFGFKNILWRRNWFWGTISVLNEMILRIALSCNLVT